MFADRSMWLTVGFAAGMFLSGAGAYSLARQQIVGAIDRYDDGLPARIGAWFGLVLVACASLSVASFAYWLTQALQHATVDQIMRGEGGWRIPLGAAVSGAVAVSLILDLITECRNADPESLARKVVEVERLTRDRDAQQHIIGAQLIEIKMLRGDLQSASDRARRAERALQVARDRLIVIRDRAAAKSETAEATPHA